MKFLIIQPWISYRGSEKISVDLAWHLNNNGHIALVAAVFIDYQRLPLHGRDISFLCPPWWVGHLCRQSKAAWLFFGLPALFFLLLKNCPSFDILNPHNLPTYWLAFLLGRITKKPVVWTCHNLPQKPALGRVSSLVWDLLISVIDRVIIPRFDLITAFSKKTASQLVYFAARKVLVHAPPIDHDLFNKKCQGSYAAPLVWRDAEFKLILVSALHPVKNFYLAFSGLQLFKKAGYSFKLLVVGGGSYKDKLIELCRKLDLQDDIFFLGYIPAEYLGDLLGKAVLNLNPAYVAEGCSLAPLEALAVGTPSLTVSFSGVDEYLLKWKRGLVCDNDAGSFFSNLVWARDNAPRLKELGYQDPSFMVETSWDTYVAWFIEQVHPLIKN